MQKGPVQPVKGAAQDPGQEPGEEEAGVQPAEVQLPGVEGTEAASPSKQHMDKMSLDLIVAVEQVIQARQHADQHICELQDRLTHSNGHIERLNRDLRNLHKVLEERDKSIAELEYKLTAKNLKVDQVMDDYRELQAVLSSEIEELKSVIELEQQKYGSLLQKHNDMHAEKTKRIHELEEKIGKLEIENSHMQQKYEAQRQEKAYLVNMISDFTNRMAVPLGAGGGKGEGTEN